MIDAYFMDLERKVNNFSELSTLILHNWDILRTFVA